MNRDSRYSHNSDFTLLDFHFDNEDEENDHLAWNFLPTENVLSNEEEKTEILWSRENKYLFSDRDFFNSEHDNLSDFSGRSTSSCSWHNDEFDMKSSVSVSKSLEAIEDAFYDQKRSSFISEEVYQECCVWSRKFPYLRLKGEQIMKICDKNKVNELSQIETLGNSENSPINLHIEGKKIVLCTAEKPLKRNKFEVLNDFDALDSFEEIIMSHDETKESCDFDNRETSNTKISHVSNLACNTDLESTLNTLKNKVIERLAQHLWPQVLELLQKGNGDKKPDNRKTDKTDEDFQLPPIVAVQVEQRRIVPHRRPQTEGACLSVSDFPELTSFLSVSPKVLQDRKESKSGRSSSAFYRPNSEIHSIKRNNAISLLNSRSNAQNVSSVVKTFSSKDKLIIKKGPKRDEDYDKMSLYLPALEEDINDSSDCLKEVPFQAQPKHISSSTISHFPKKPECFLPPIDTDTMHSELKLTRNLFTFLESDMKYLNKVELSHKPRTPASRPNTSASKKELLQPENSNCKNLKNNYSSIKSSSQGVKKRISQSSDSQVTLFPIVTSLLPSREKSCSGARKTHPRTLSGQRR